MFQILITGFLSGLLIVYHVLYRTYCTAHVVQQVLYRTRCTAHVVQHVLYSTFYRRCCGAGVSGPLVDSSHVCFTEDTHVVGEGAECLDGECPAPVVLGRGEGEGGGGGGDGGGGGGDGGGGGGGGY